MSISLQVPRKLKPLLSPKRYKGAYGGRGGAKSHFFAEQVLIKCYVKTTRVVCIREVQASIKDSVKQLLTDKITKLGLEEYFEILESEIRGPNGSIIVFKGMQSYNAANIKSLEGYDIAWIEEAQTLSQHSLDLLRPTIRKDGSELWFSWNPRYKTDPVDAFFRKNPPEDAISIFINWQDNPWFPEVLKREMLHDYAVDEDKADHVWGGGYGVSQGSVIGKWLNKARRQDRVKKGVIFDPLGAPIEVSSDLGFRDTASWWFWQRCPGGFRLLKYTGASGWDADDWIPEIFKIVGSLIGIVDPDDKNEQHKKIIMAALGRIWLPHDSRAKTFQSKHTSMEKFITAFGANKLGLVPQSSKADQISAAREVIDRCEFDEELCEEGLDGLAAWEFEYDDENNIFSREPKHNWASHPSDGYAYGCQVMKDFEPPKSEALPVFPVQGVNGRIVTAPLNDLWATTPKKSGRI